MDGFTHMHSANIGNVRSTSLKEKKFRETRKSRVTPRGVSPVA